MQTVRAAAELALSVLPHAHALNYNEIQRAVLQCKEQSDAMLERACLTVEAAAKGIKCYYVFFTNICRTLEFRKLSMLYMSCYDINAYSICVEHIDY